MILTVLLIIGILAGIIAFAIFIFPAIFETWKNYCKNAWWDANCEGIRSTMLLEEQNKK